jgi:hypothetical protein
MKKLRFLENELNPTVVGYSAISYGSWAQPPCHMAAVV